MSQKVLITGFTGVIGKRIAYELAKKGALVYAPIRARDAADLQQRHLDVLEILREVVPHYDRLCEGRIIPFAGDLRLENFGLSEAQVHELGLGAVSEVWHLAAALDLTETNSAEVFETNVGGTRFLLGFMERHGIRDLQYFSTFAVHGHKPEGVAIEEVLKEPSAFRNSYEQSKWESEQMVWEAHQSGKIRAAIFRPSIVVGDSVIGRYEQFNAFNHAFDVASRLRKRLAEKDGQNLDEGGLKYPLRIPGVEEATLNIVPLDYVVSTVMKLHDSGMWAGKVFHITNPEPPRLSQMMKIFQLSEPWEGLKWCSQVGPDRFADGYEKFAFKQYGFLIPYLMGEAKFDQSNVESILNGSRQPVCNETFLKAIAQRALKNGWQEA